LPSRFAFAPGLESLAATLDYHRADGDCLQEGVAAEVLLATSNATVYGSMVTSFSFFLISLSLTQIM
jgi:hypothetical protein